MIVVTLFLVVVNMKEFIIKSLQRLSRYILNNYPDRRSIKYFDHICFQYDRLLERATLPDKKYQSKEHLQWMLVQIRTDKTQSITKKHRWLGYVQGILTSHGIIDVDIERDSTRSVFNGD